ncbi:MAG: hypothetical protein HOV87_22355 [Catenulispora sp.]|nr:hypothetical protein [Catenulispora sp.]
MAQVEPGGGARVSPPSAILAELRGLAAAADVRPEDDTVLAQALRRLHEDRTNLKRPRGLAYHDLTSAG